MNIIESKRLNKEFNHYQEFNEGLTKIEKEVYTDASRLLSCYLSIYWNTVHIGKDWERDQDYIKNKLIKDVNIFNKYDHVKFCNFICSKRGMKELQVKKTRKRRNVRLLERGAPPLSILENRSFQFIRCVIRDGYRDALNKYEMDFFDHDESFSIDEDIREDLMQSSYYKCEDLTSYWVVKIARDLTLRDSLDDHQSYNYHDHQIKKTGHLFRLEKFMIESLKEIFEFICESEYDNQKDYYVKNDQKRIKKSNDIIRIASKELPSIEEKSVLDKNEVEH